MRFIAFFLAATLVWACSTTEQSIPQSEVFSYLALGDSYTIGHSLTEAERYPNQLADSLIPKGITLSPVDIVAKTGWTTDELDAGINDRTDLQNTYDLVSLLIGVNNEFRGRPVATYEPEFRALVDRAIDFADGEHERVFIVSIPDYAFTPFGQGNTNISEDIDEYNAANKRIAEEYGIKYFDITPISREGLNQPDLVADDRLHPSGLQYGLWVSSFLEEVEEMLRN
ncbi:MAG: SGNH/GDSL hydrolase family protein [Bacteroidota bacterium]